MDAIELAAFLVQQAKDLEGLLSTSMPEKEQHAVLQAYDDLLDYVKRGVEIVQRAARNNNDPAAIVHSLLQIPVTLDPAKSRLGDAVGDLKAVL